MRKIIVFDRKKKTDILNEVSSACLLKINVLKKSHFYQFLFNFSFVFFLGTLKKKRKSKNDLFNN